MRAGSIALAGLVLWAGAAPAQQVPRVEAVYHHAGVPGRPEAADWKSTPAASLTLTPQIIVPPNGGGAVTELTLRAMHDGEWLAIRLEWADATADREVGVDTFRDAAAVGFPVSEPEPPPSPFMGDPDHPVSIWQWTADLEAQARGQGGFAARYPHTEGVWYFPQDAAVQREVRAWRGTEPVVEFVATGFGTLTRRAGRNVLAASEHRNGRWAVVLRRRLSTGDPEDPAFKPGETAQLIVAVWDGSRGEVNGRKSVTLNWVPLALGTTVKADAGR